MNSPWPDNTNLSKQNANYESRCTFSNLTAILDLFHRIYTKANCVKEWEQCQW